MVPAGGDGSDSGAICPRSPGKNGAARPLAPPVAAGDATGPLATRISRDVGVSAERSGTPDSNRRATTPIISDAIASAANVICVRRGVIQTSLKPRGGQA